MQTSALEFIEEGLAALERSVQGRDGDLRNIQLATLSPEGHPGLRTLVLREFGRSPPLAEMHSDARAGKVRDIAHAHQVTFLAWSAAEHLQLRFTGQARLHQSDEVARDRWDKLSPAARSTYGLRGDPGSAIAQPEDQRHLPADEQYRQFTVILVEIADVDVLRLGQGGQQTRAFGRFTETGIMPAWIGP